MTDHKAQALVELSEIMLNFDEGENGTARATIAQVHATLYLAEQRRIANLIAFIAEWNLGQQREDEGAGRGREAVIKASSQIMDGLAL